MAKIKILVDSTSDMPVDWIQKLDVDIVPLYVNWPDGTSEKDDTRDYQQLQKFYQKLVESSELPKTSQPSIEDWRAVYEKYEKEGYDGILVLTISTAMSGTFNSASLAAKMVKIPVQVVDTKMASSIIANMARYVRELIESSMELEKVAEEVMKKRQANKFGAFFYVSDFNFLVKGGRVSRFQGFVGSLLKIKVGIYIDDEGNMIPFSKARGTKSAIDMLLNKCEEIGFKPGQEVGLTMVGCNSEEDLKQIENALKARYKIKYLAYTPTGKVISTHVGPGMAGFGIEAL